MLIEYHRSGAFGVVVLRVGRTLPVLLLALVTLGSGPLRAEEGELLPSHRWVPCEGKDLRVLGFECATLQRPLDRHYPGGLQVQLAVFRRPATGTPEQRIGTLFFNPGGPGQPGHSSAPSKVFFLPSSLQQAFDFVTWDPRGLGRSTPTLTDCAVGYPRRRLTGSVDWEQVLGERQAELNQANADCIRRHPELIRGMGTVETVHDLEALRLALAEPLLNYWGISYGTVIGSSYAALFPDKVRTLVLDGNVSPWTNLQGLSASATAQDDAIRFFLQTHPQYRALFERLLQSLDQQALQLSDGALYTRWDLLDALVNVIYLSRLAGTYGGELISTVDRALFGDTAQQRDDALRGLNNPLFRTPPVDSNAAAGFAATLCRDFPERPTAAEQISLLKPIVPQTPLYGATTAVDFLAACSGFEAVAADPVPRAPFASKFVSGLILGSTWDFSTPLAWTTAMARAFPSMRMVTVVGNEHGLFTNVQSSCLDDPVVDYLLTAQLPQTDLTCDYQAPVESQPF